MALGSDGVARFFTGLAAGPVLRQRAAAMGRLDAMRSALIGTEIGDKDADTQLKQTKLSALDPDTLAQSFSAIGLPQDQAQGAAGLARAGNNANEVGELVSTLQKLGMQRAARDAAISGDQNLANANLFGVANKPVTLSQVVDGVSLNPTVTPDQNSFDPTAVGQAMINERDAAASNSSASAAATNAKLPAQLGLIQAQTDKAKASTGASKLPPIHDITAILPKTAPAGNPFGQPVTNPTDVATALAWLAQNPGKNVGDYVTQAPVGSPGTVADHGNLVVPMPTGKGPLLATKAAPAPAPAEPETPAEDAAEPGEEGASGPAMPKSQADFDALPKGALFINPADGQLRRKK